VVGKDGRARDRLTKPTGAEESDVVLALRAQDLANLGAEALDPIADPPLPELAET
jgi:hypothetical protein